MRQVALVTAAALVCVARPGRAADPVPDLGGVEVEGSRLVAIQNRKYALGHELALAGGALPVDPYHKGLIGTLGYTLHFNEHLAWEVVQFTYAYNLETSLLRKITRIAVQSPNVDDRPELPAIAWIAASHVVLKPLYGKEALFNTRVIHLEAFVQAGPAVVGMSGTDVRRNLGLDLGLGLRLWLTRDLSARFDLGELLYLHDGDDGLEVRGALELRLGVAFTFGGDA